MCLIINRHETAEFFRKHDPDEEITVWKVYKVSGNKGENICPPFYRGRISPGWIISNRRTTSIRGQTIVARGIHVFLTRESARDYRGCFSSRVTDRVFKCKAKVSDLVALNLIQAVFMKIHITKEEFERGKKGRN